MATLLNLANANVIVRLNQPLPGRAQPIRSFFLRQEAIDDIQNKIVGAPSDRGLDTSPLEELNDLLTVYVGGNQLAFGGQFHPLEHVDAGIWELKTVDVRVFGWFAAHDHFVCTNVDMKKTVKTGGLYPHYRDRAVSFRHDLDLDEPKFVPGDDPANVISNYSYPA